MFWFWLGFFAFVALLLFLDLAVLHRRQKEPSLKSAIFQTILWVALGLAFTGVVYLIYDQHWLGAHLVGCPPGHSDGADASITYISAYLLEQALSVDNLFAMALIFARFKVPAKYQHRVLFWGIIGAVLFRIAMLSGGAYLAEKFTWIFYIFGAYLAFQGIKLWIEVQKGDDDDDDEKSVHDNSFVVKLLRPFVRVVEGDHGGMFTVKIDGRRALTTVAICLIVVELTDVVFALDSIPAVLSVSQETFIMVTSNIMAILGLRSMYFVLAGAMAKFHYLKLALAVLLVLIGAKMIAHDWYPVSHVVSLLAIAGILATGVIASIIANRRAADRPI